MWEDELVGLTALGKRRQGGRCRIRGGDGDRDQDVVLGKLLEGL